MLKILSGLVKVGAASITTDDEKEAKKEAAEKAAAAIIERMAAKKEPVTLDPAAVAAVNLRPVSVASVSKPVKPVKVAPEADEDGEEYDVENEASKLEGLNGLDVEILGCFVWVSGDTKKQRDKLKELKYRWSSDKKKWYKRPPQYFKKSKRKWTFEEIEQTFKKAA